MENSISSLTMRLTEQLDRLENGQSVIYEKIENGGIMVTIRNGGGINAQMKLVDLLQVIYDRPTESQRRREKNLTRLVTIGKNLAWIVGAIVTLGLLFDKFAQMTHPLK